MKRYFTFILILFSSTAFISAAGIFEDTERFLQQEAYTPEMTEPDTSAPEVLKAPIQTPEPTAEAAPEPAQEPKPEPAPAPESAATQAPATTPASAKTAAEDPVLFPGPRDLSDKELLEYYHGFPEYVAQAMYHKLLPPEQRTEDIKITIPEGEVILSGAHGIGRFDDDYTDRHYITNGVLAEPATVTISGYKVPLAPGYMVFFHGESKLVEGLPTSLGNPFVIAEDTVLPGNYYNLKYAANTPVRMDYMLTSVMNGTLAEDQLVGHNVLPAGTYVEFDSGADPYRVTKVLLGRLQRMKSPKPVLLKGGKYDLLFTEAEFDEKGYLEAGTIAQNFSANGMSFKPGDHIEFAWYAYNNDEGDSGDPTKMDFLKIGHWAERYGEVINLEKEGEENRIAAAERQKAREAEEKARPTSYEYEGVTYGGRISFHPNGQFWGGDLLEDTEVRGYLFMAGERVSFNDDGSLNTGVLAEETIIQDILLYDQVRFYPSGNLMEGRPACNQSVNGVRYKYRANYYFEDTEVLTQTAGSLSRNM